MRVEQDATNFPKRCIAGTSCFVNVSGHGTVWVYSQIPRLRTDCTGWIRSEQMTTDFEGSSGAYRLEEHHITSVLLAFNWRRVLNIQSLMASTQFEILTERHSVWSGWPWPLTCVSSANIWHWSPCARMTLSSSAVYIVNKSGPRTEPWGTPHVVEVEDDANSP